MKVSVIIPMYNEESCISTTIEKVAAAMEKPNYDWELLLINDGSTDNTLDVCKKYENSNKRIKICSYPNNMGRGKALKVGFSNASGDIIVTTESDLTWGTDVLLKMIDILTQSSTDVVIASPYAPGGKLVGVSILRHILSRVGNKVLSFALGGSLTMLSGMTRAYKRNVIDSLDLMANDKEIHLEILSKVMALGYNIKETPAILKWEKPKEKQKTRKSTFRYGKYILSHLLFSFNETPFLLIGTIGITFLLLGIIAAIYTIYLKFTVTLVGRFTIITLTTLLLVVGIQILIFLFLANQNRDIRKELIRTKGAILRLNKKK